MVTRIDSGSKIRFIPGIGINIMSPSAAATDWWLSGGIAAANCIAAYQAKGAASYAASLVNLANPGMYDLTEGNGAVAWDAVNAWQFVAAQAKYFITGITPALGWSVIARFASVTAGDIFGAYSNESVNYRFSIRPDNGSGSRNYFNGSFLSKAGVATNARMGFTNRTAYLNGVNDGNITTAVATFRTIYLGANNTGGVGFYLSGNPLGIAFYDTEITPVQYLAVDTALAAIP